MWGFLDDFPFATVASIVGLVLTVIAYLDNVISFEDALLYLGAYQAGTAAIGYVRTHAGKGVRR